ncbi:MAG: FAD-dependent oxidoreductase [Candidatus Nanopelagicaceae bacterium]|nr:FAD-dependent oxidoreductase [Candidatus Nanopelagicaceae bacterium]
MATSVLPQRAKIVIIGGGVGGTSVAYHLAELGEKDVILLDRNDLTSGSTFHSAGLVGQLRADPTLTKMNMHSVDLYRKLEGTGTPPGWKECGSIKLASTPERMEEIRRQIGWARTFGLDLKEISPRQAQELFPLMDVEGVVGACYMASDGQVDPSQLAQALASGARANGVQIFTHTRVLGIKTANGRVTHVETEKGTIECEIVVNCGGMFAPEIGRLVGVRIPIVPMSHQYLITENFMPAGEPYLPSLRDPDLLIYFRQEVSGLLMGGYERNSKAWTADYEHLDNIPSDFNGRLLPEEWDRFEEIAINSQIRVPKMGEVGVKNFINGPEGFTPDNEFCLGETSVGGFYVAAGFCAHGIAGAGGIGKVVAEWIVAGEPTMDLWHMDIRRFGGSYASPKFTLERVTENYEAYYDIHYPGEERQSARPSRKSAIYEWHKEAGAVFGEKASWERVNFYTSNLSDDSLQPYGWAGKHWSSAVRTEHLATRESAGLFDESSFAKISVKGEDCSEFLNYVCANDVVKGVGRTVYTQALNSRGGIESDFTVTRLFENEYMIVTGTAFGVHDIGWLEKIAREKNFDVSISDITSSLACFGIWGPKAREILQILTEYDMSHKNFPFMHSREIVLGGVKVRATRITYVGELGWELYLPTGDGVALWHQIIETGKQFDLKVCGYRAIESLRLEKGYRAWGVEISTETNPWEAGLNFAVAIDKEVFHGKESLLKASARVARKLVPILFDDIRQVPLGNEPIKCGDEIIGRVKSGGQGYTINKAIAYTYLPIEYSSVGTVVSVEFFGQWCKGVVAAEPLFDPTNSRIRS